MPIKCDNITVDGSSQILVENADAQKTPPAPRGGRPASGKDTVLPDGSSSTSENQVNAATKPATYKGVVSEAMSGVRLKLAGVYDGVSKLGSARRQAREIINLANGETWDKDAAFLAGRTWVAERRAEGALTDEQVTALADFMGDRMHRPTQELYDAGYSEASVSVMRGAYDSLMDFVQELDADGGANARSTKIRRASPDMGGTDASRTGAAAYANPADSGNQQANAEGTLETLAQQLFGSTYDRRAAAQERGNARSTSQGAGAFATVEGYSDDETWYNPTAYRERGAGGTTGDVAQSGEGAGGDEFEADVRTGDGGESGRARGSTWLILDEEEAKNIDNFLNPGASAEDVGSEVVDNIVARGANRTYMGDDETPVQRQIFPTTASTGTPARTRKEKRNASLDEAINAVAQAVNDVFQKLPEHVQQEIIEDVETGQEERQRMIDAFEEWKLMDEDTRPRSWVHVYQGPRPASTFGGEYIQRAIQNYIDLGQDYHTINSTISVRGDNGKNRQRPRFPELASAGRALSAIRAIRAKWEEAPTTDNRLGVVNRVLNRYASNWKTYQQRLKFWSGLQSLLSNALTHAMIRADEEGRQGAYEWLGRYARRIEETRDLYLNRYAVPVLQNLEDPDDIAAAIVDRFNGRYFLPEEHDLLADTLSLVRAQLDQIGHDTTLPRVHEDPVLVENMGFVNTALPHTVQQQVQAYREKLDRVLDVWSNMPSLDRFLSHMQRDLFTTQDMLMTEAKFLGFELNQLPAYHYEFLSAHLDDHGILRSNFADYTVEAENRLRNVLNYYRENIRDSISQYVFYDNPGQKFLMSEERWRLESVMLGILMRKIFVGEHAISMAERRALTASLSTGFNDLQTCFMGLALSEGYAWLAAPLNATVPPRQSHDLFRMAASLNMFYSDIERLMRAYNGQRVPFYVDYDEHGDIKVRDPWNSYADLEEYLYVIPVDMQGNMHPELFVDRPGALARMRAENLLDRDLVRATIKKEGERRVDHIYNPANYEKRDAFLRAWPAQATGVEQELHILPKYRSEYVRGEGWTNQDRPRLGFKTERRAEDMLLQAQWEARSMVKERTGFDTTDDAQAESILQTMNEDQRKVMRYLDTITNNRRAEAKAKAGFDKYLFYVYEPSRFAAPEHLRLMKETELVDEYNDHISSIGIRLRAKYPNVQSAKNALLGEQQAIEDTLKNSLYPAIQSNNPQDRERALRLLKEQHKLSDGPHRLRAALPVNLDDDAQFFQLMLSPRAERFRNAWQAWGPLPMLYEVERAFDSIHTERGQAALRETGDEPTPVRTFQLPDTPYLPHTHLYSRNLHRAYFSLVAKSRAGLPPREYLYQSVNLYSNGAFAFLERDGFENYPLINARTDLYVAGKKALNDIFTAVPHEVLTDYAMQKWHMQNPIDAQTWSRMRDLTKLSKDDRARVYQLKTLVTFPSLSVPPNVVLDLMDYLLRMPERLRESMIREWPIFEDFLVNVFPLQVHYDIDEVGAAVVNNDTAVHADPRMNSGTERSYILGEKYVLPSYEQKAIDIKNDKSATMC